VQVLQYVSHLLVVHDESDGSQHELPSWPPPEQAQAPLVHA
jgi:hypothetical protein